jgi:phosphoglycolate phosphatase
VPAIRHVIWDFNGTLLDDVDCCVLALNTLLAERNLSAITRAGYVSHFGFPVQDFYRRLGFDFEREDFTALAQTFILRYGKHVERAAPHPEVAPALAAIRHRSIAQSVLSAMEQGMLLRLLEHFGLAQHMTHIRGLQDHAAVSKVDLGLQLGREIGLLPEQMLLVGDTLHDHEAARAIGCHCLLYAHGHQAKERLAQSGARLIESLSEVAAFVDARGNTS